MYEKNYNKYSSLDNDEFFGNEGSETEDIETESTPRRISVFTPPLYSPNPHIPPLVFKN